jgi:hypothetical protein
MLSTVNVDEVPPVTTVYILEDAYFLFSLEASQVPLTIPAF